MKLAQSLYSNIVENSFRLNIRKRQFNTFNQQMKVVPIPTIGSYFDLVLFRKINRLFV